jgi:hypothetical protein
MRDATAQGWTGYRFVCLGNSLYTKGNTTLPYCEGEGLASQRGCVAQAPSGLSPRRGGRGAT